MFFFLSHLCLVGQKTGSAPTFIGKPVIRQVEKAIVFECRLKCDPQPTITWLQGSKVIENGGRYVITQTKEGADLYIITLQISNIGIQDGGEYKVLAKNARGDATATINLNLEGKQSCCGEYHIPFNASLIYRLTISSHLSLFKLLTSSIA